MDNPWHDESWHHDDGGMMEGTAAGDLLAVGALATAVLALVMIAILVAVVVDRRSHQTPGPQRPPGDDPMSVLDGRLARGELSAEDYRATRALLDQGASPTRTGTTG